MVVVLKNNKDFVKKIQKIITASDELKDNLITIVIDNKFYDQIEEEMDSLKFGKLHYPGENNLYLARDKRIVLKKVDQYI